MSAYTGSVYAFNRFTGKLLWESDLSQQNKARKASYGLEDALTMSDDMIFVNNYLQVFAINKTDGSVRWMVNNEKLGETRNFFIKAIYDPAHKKVFVVDKWRVYALEAQTGEIVWRFAPPADKPEKEAGSRFSNTALPYVYQDTVFVRKFVSEITYGLSVQDGSIKTEFVLRGVGLSEEPVQTVGKNLLISNRGNMTLFDPEAEKNEWWFESRIGSERAPMIYKNLVVLGGAGDRTIYVVDLKTGDELFRIALDKDIVSVRSLWIDSSGLYFLAKNTNIYAFEFDCPQLQQREGFN